MIFLKRPDPEPEARHFSDSDLQFLWLKRPKFSNSFIILKRLHLRHHHRCIRYYQEFLLPYLFPQPLQVPEWTEMGLPHSGQLHFPRSFFRNSSIPISRMSRMFWIGDSVSGYLSEYRVSFSMTSSQGKSGHSSQNLYPFSLLFRHRTIPQPLEQNSGLWSSGPHHPAQGRSFLWA